MFKILINPSANEKKTEMMASLKQNDEVIQNMSGVYLIGLIFIK